MKSENKNLNAQKVLEFLKKRKVVSAVAVVAVVALVATVFAVNTSNNTAQPVSNVKEPQSDFLSGLTGGSKPTKPVVKEEVVKMPLHQPEKFVVAKPFYDTNMPLEQQELALSFYNKTYFENKGVDFVAKDKKSFDVIAAVSGEVVEITKDGLLGNIVVVKTKDGLVTTYSPMAEVLVAKGGQVKQGQLIGTSGTNELNKKLGAHLHFEVQVAEGANVATYVNPSLVWDKQLSSIAKIAEAQYSATTVSGTPAADNAKKDAAEKPAVDNAKKDAAEKPATDNTEKPANENRQEENAQ
ncbi:MAG: peptidoglycan DD-metalloendopeptidase family protein [Bacilli bacterium]